jgi:hypothetical protein
MFYLTIVIFISLFHHGDISHGIVRCGAMPVFLVRFDPDHVTGTNFLGGATPELEMTAANPED